MHGFALRLPVICAPMFRLSGPEMVMAACKAGIGGAFPCTNARTLDELDQWMASITDTLSPVDGPWIANLITHSTHARLADELRLVAQYKPPIVITALGSPKPVMETVKSYGGLVFADVVNMRLAKKAADAEVDGMACISAGAGGHTGNLSPFAFISAVREIFKGVIVVGGGIADGAGVAGAVAAGADCVYMGTRFIATEESRADPRYKSMVIDAQTDDLVVSSAITGTPASWLKASTEEAGLSDEDLAGTVPRDYSSGDVKKWRDIWAAGQGVGQTSEIESVAKVVDGLHREYLSALARLGALSFK
ncbi:MAG: nitronate monooxygenase [Luminiphilus sp.]|nr:nitronate monooxygenase [Luminiphilus sp.]